MRNTAKLSRRSRPSNDASSDKSGFDSWSGMVRLKLTVDKLFGPEMFLIHKKRVAIPPSSEDAEDLERPRLTS